MTDPVAQSITITPLGETPTVLCAPAFLTALAQVERDVAHLKVTDAPTAQAAATLIARLTKASSALEQARTTLKAPFLAKGAEIDRAALEPAKRIVDAKKALQRMLGDWDEKQREERAAEQRRKDEERLKAEAEIAKAKAAATPTLDVGFDDAAPAVPAPQVQGVAWRVSLRIKSVNVAEVPEEYLDIRVNDAKIRREHCVGWRDGQPVPVVKGVVFEVERTPVSTGRTEF